MQNVIYAHGPNASMQIQMHRTEYHWSMENTHARMQGLLHSLPRLLTATTWLFSVVVSAACPQLSEVDIENSFACWDIISGC